MLGQYLNVGDVYKVVDGEGTIRITHVCSLYVRAVLDFPTQVVKGEYAYPQFQKYIREGDIVKIDKDPGLKWHEEELRKIADGVISPLEELIIVASGDQDVTRIRAKFSIWNYERRYRYMEIPEHLWHVTHIHFIQEFAKQLRSLGAIL